LVEPAAYNKSIPDFVDFLDSGLKSYHKKQDL
jgi:hypothetical protein